MCFSKHTRHWSLHFLSLRSPGGRSHRFWSSFCSITWEGENNRMRWTEKERKPRVKRTFQLNQFSFCSLLSDTFQPTSQLWLSHTHKHTQPATPLPTDKQHQTLTLTHKHCYTQYCSVIPSSLSAVEVFVCVMKSLSCSLSLSSHHSSPSWWPEGVKPKRQQTALPFTTKCRAN